MQYLRLQNPNTSLVLAGLTPRGNDFTTGRFLWPSNFTVVRALGVSAAMSSQTATQQLVAECWRAQGLTTINAWQQQMASVLPDVAYADCSAAVLRDGKVSWQRWRHTPEVSNVRLTAPVLHRSRPASCQMGCIPTRKACWRWRSVWLRLWTSCTTLELQAD